MFEYGVIILLGLLGAFASFQTALGVYFLKKFSDLSFSDRHILYVASTCSGIIAVVCIYLAISCFFSN